MAVSIQIDVICLEYVCYAVRHFPEGSPKRWQNISLLVKECDASNDKHVVNIGPESFKKSKQFDFTPNSCKKVYELLSVYHPQYLTNRREKFAEKVLNDSSTPGIKPLVLVPASANCSECQHRLKVRCTPSYPTVYCSNGPTVAASYYSQCDQCKISYFYSYKEKNGQRFYLPSALDRRFLQVSRRTIFEISLIEQFGRQLTYGYMGFQASSDMYNDQFRNIMEDKLSNFKNFARQGTDSWELYETRTEEAWFLHNILKYIKKYHLWNELEIQRHNTSKRIHVELLCGQILERIRQEYNQWMDHTCSVKGCQEGYVSIDGNEKLRRPMCKAPKVNVKLKFGMPKIVQCCTSSPITGNLHQAPSPFCKEHKFLQEATSDDEPVSKNPKLDYECSRSDNGLKIVLTLKDFCKCHSSSLALSSTQNLPENEDTTTMIGCKKKENVTRFYDRTAGILAMVKPCGIILDISEMYTCESSSQVFAWLLRVLEKNPLAVKYIGYDRACELEPFLINLSKCQGNPGSQWLLDKIKFLVDIWHCEKHKSLKCFPYQNNPECRYHPKLDRFEEIHGSNTECAEQAFVYLGRFKFIVRKLTQYKFKFLCMLLCKNATKEYK